jgi:uncharacterized protein (DUF1697 family)
MPTNAKMPALKAAFETAGFTDVRTLLGSGNVLFTSPRASESALQRRAEAAMADQLGKAFLTIVRSVDYLRELLASEPFGHVRLKPETKRIISFLRDQPAHRPRLPITLGTARILAMNDREVFSMYERGGTAPDFMVLIEKAFGKEVTTRTWETVTKAAR